MNNRSCLIMVGTFLIFGLVCADQALSAGVTDWWDTDWLYRVKISCDEDHDEYSTNHYLGIASHDITGAKYLDSGDDARIVFQNAGGQTDLGRHITIVNTTDAGIYWKVQETIPANEDIGGEADYKYYLYYGNAGAGAPGAYTNTDCIDAPYSVDGNTEALYHYEEASGTIYDETANNNDAADGGAIVYGATGKFGKCLEYSGGLNAYVWGDWYENDPPVAAMTISFWMYADTKKRPIVQFNEDHSPLSSVYDRGFAIDSLEYLRWKIYDGGDYVCVSNNTVSLGEWVHVAGVVDESIGSDSGLILYINGVADDTVLGCDGGYMGYTDVEFLHGLGHNTGWGVPGDYPFAIQFDGKIDELLISSVTETNFYHITNEATLTLGSEENAPTGRRRKMILMGE